MDGFLLVDKPAGWTSHDVVAKLRNVIGLRRIGHGGTLDPLATGLLVVGIGKATKALEQFVQGDKTYLAEATLGATSTTDDAEGEITYQTINHPSLSKTVLDKLRGMLGEQDQLPPVYSALKTAGKKHYELARAGQVVERQPRRITVHSIDLVEYAWPRLSFRCSVSKGTYIRALARDLGERLGTGAHLSALHRERVGGYVVADAVTLDQIEQNWQEHLISLDQP